MVIRYVPFVQREEFVNVGVLLICPDVEFQQVMTIPGFGEGSKAKLLAGSDGQFVRHAVGKLSRAVNSRSINDLLGHAEPKTLLSLEDLNALHHIYSANNVRLTAPRPAVTVDPQATLEQLFEEFVGKISKVERSSVLNRTRIRNEVTSVFKSLDLVGQDKLLENWEVPTTAKPIVDLAYKNHVWHCYQAISFAVKETDCMNAVMAYRQTAADARNSTTDEDISKAGFAVLGFLPPSPSERVKSLLQVLKDDQIDYFDYREAPHIAQVIARDLRANQSLTIN